MTTTPRNRPTRRTRPLGGRLKVVAQNAAVTALGLILMLSGISVALRVTVENNIAQSITQEIGEVRQFSSTGLDPQTGQAIGTADRFAALYLERQHAQPNEVLVALDAQGAVVTEKSGTDAPSVASLAPQVQEQVLTPGTSGTVADPVHGTVSWQTVPVQASDSEGAIALIAMHHPLEQQTRVQLGQLALLALGALAIAVLAAWLISGRVLGHLDTFEREATEALKADHLSPVLPEEGNADYQQLARTANALTAQATEALAAEQEFSHDLAHQLRTPLAIVQGNLEQPDQTEEAREITRRKCLAEVVHLNRVVSHLVVLNRCDEPDYVRTDTEYDVGDFVAGYVDLWQAKRDDIGPSSVTVRVGDNLDGVQAYLDEPRLARVLDELVDNAVNASATDGEVVVSSVLVPTDNAEGADNDERADGAKGVDNGDGADLDLDGTADYVVAIDVTDHGRGVPEAERDDVLRRFVRAGNDPHLGSGLGLAVADRLARAMGGRVRLFDNGETAGTTARVELRPVNPADGVDGTRTTV